jgi:hypothetical protein
MVRFDGQAQSDHMQHRADAVLHVEIGLTLITVAEYPQFCWIVQQLFVEIKYVTVSVSFAEDRYEWKI